MARFAELSEAIAEHVRPGVSVALEGFSHLVPYAAGQEIIRQRVGDLTVIRMVPDLVVDQMIGLGMVATLVFSWGGNPGLGSLYRLRDAAENGWPRPLRLVEHSHAELANRFVAGAAHLPYMLMRGSPVGDLRSPHVAEVTCPFTGERATAVQALHPDVAVVHAQEADREGNVLFRGVIGVQKEAILASRAAVVTVERMVDALPRGSNEVIVPGWAVSAVCVCPRGAWPSYAMGGGYARDDDFYRRWREVSRDRSSFLAWGEGAR